MEVHLCSPFSMTKSNMYIISTQIGQCIHVTSSCWKSHIKTARIDLNWWRTSGPLRLKVTYHDDVIKWKHFPRNWPFVREIHRSPVNFPHKGQWRGALMFSLNYAWINDWVNNREAGDLRRQHGHYDVIVMHVDFFKRLQAWCSWSPQQGYMYPSHITVPCKINPKLIQIVTKFPIS